MNQLLSRKEQKARKPHVCDFCHEEISKGESYVHTVSLDGSRVVDSKIHIFCEALAVQYTKSTGQRLFKERRVLAWIQREVCAKCDASAECSRSEPIVCPLVLESLLPPALLSHEDIQRRIAKKGVR